MRLVIDIPDGYETKYKSINNGSIAARVILNCVANATLLPKGHGDLVDRSEVIKSLFDYHKGEKTIGQCIDDVQTIVEADKSESEE